MTGEGKDLGRANIADIETDHAHQREEIETVTAIEIVSAVGNLDLTMIATGGIDKVMMDLHGHVVMMKETEEVRLQPCIEMFQC